MSDVSIATMIERWSGLERPLFFGFKTWDDVRKLAVSHE